MSIEKNKSIKHRLHPRNRNRERYDLAALLLSTPALKDHVQPNRHGEDSINFSNPQAVKLLNQALLKHYYGIEYWAFPDEHLCPPIPGRADYIHYVADLLSESNYGQPPKGKQITCLDIGTGASGIYPIIGLVEYGWNFLGSDIDPQAIASVQNIVQQNPALKGKVHVILQEQRDQIFQGILQKNDCIDLSICNPPFHASVEAAQKGNIRKVKNLSGKPSQEPILNFSGSQHELIYKGGEVGFIQKMVQESSLYAKNCYWFSTLVSKQSHLKKIYQCLKTVSPIQIRTIPMGTGNKSSRIVAWTFFSKKERSTWSRQWSKKP